ncbi:MAG TPA: hypothetical protein VL383_13480 [Gemmatimonadaceae bacterium]|nr:hypothetical protein [Gemmatimonadaceae bacterium]
MADRNARLNDDDVQKVIARALELQADSARALTVAQVREIASELAIPDSAVEQALAEYEAEAAAASRHTDGAGSQRAPSGIRIPRWLVVALGTVGGSVILLILARLFVSV